jgi:DNA mismatch endonuclease, patch repair protein
LSAEKYIRDGRAPIPKDEKTSRVMSAIRAKNTGPEMQLRKTLFQIGVRGYRLHWKQVPGKPDIAFPKRKMAVFINGCFWHRCTKCAPSYPKSNLDFWDKKFSRNIERDENKISSLKDLGWTVLTIWECEIKNDVIGQAEKVRKIING